MLSIVYGFDVIFVWEGALWVAVLNAFVVNADIVLVQGLDAVCLVIWLVGKKILIDTPGWNDPLNWQIAA